MKKEGRGRDGGRAGLKSEILNFFKISDPFSGFPGILNLPAGRFTDVPAFVYHKNLICKINLSQVHEERRNGTKAQRRKGITAQRHNGSTA